MMKKINHVAIAVKDLANAVETYKKLGFHYDHTEEVPSQKVKTAFFSVGESHVELLEPTAPDSPISGFLEKRGPGIHHLCIEVSDIEHALVEYKQAGVRLINPQPVTGAGGHRVAFVHPKATGGVLLELVEVKSAE